MTNGSCHRTVESNVQKCVKPASSARWANFTTSRAGAFVCATSPKSMTKASQALPQVPVQTARQVLSPTRATNVLAVLDHPRSTRQDRCHLALNGHAFVGRVVNVHVVRGRRERLRRLRVV